MSNIAKYINFTYIYWVAYVLCKFFNIKTQNYNYKKAQNYDT